MTDKLTTPEPAPCPDLSVVVPCAGGSVAGSRLEAAMRDLLDRAPGLHVEVLLVSVGAAGAAQRLGRSLAGLVAGHGARLEPRVLESGSRSFADAIRAGVAASRGAHVLVTDGRGAVAFGQVLDWAAAGHVELRASPPEKAPVLIASRQHVLSVVEESALRRTARRLTDVLVQVLCDLYLEDPTCGFKLFPGDAARRWFAASRASGRALDVELMLLARRAGHAIDTLPVRWRAPGDQGHREAPREVVAPWTLLRVRLSLYRQHALGLRTRVELGAASVAARAASCRWERGSLALFVVLVVLVLTTFTQYGVTWDEDLHRRYGQAVFTYYTTLLSAGHSREAMHFGNLYLYGGLGDVLGYVLTRVLPLGEFEVRHLGNAVFGLIGMLGTWRLARFLWGARAGALAAAALALTPSYYGHMFSNPKDIPFAAAYVWAVYYLVRALPHLPSIPAGLVIKLALAIGAALAVRAGGLLLVCYLGAIVGGYLAGRLLWERRLDAADLVTLTERVALTCVGAWAVMMAFWPFAFEAPVESLRLTLKYFSEFAFRGSMLYGGNIIPIPPTPIDYVPRMLAIRLPVLVLAAATVAILGYPRRVAALRRPGSDPAAVAGEGVVLFAMAFPLIYVVAIHAVLYDGLRHLLFALPLMTVLAARGLDGFLGAAQRHGRPVRVIVAAGLAACAAALVVTMVRLHPYEYVFYNRIVGGVVGADGRYDTDYWAASYREAVLRLEDVLAREARESGSETPLPVRVHATGPNWGATYYFPEGWEYAGGTRSADFVIATTRARSQAWLDAPVLFRVERMGVPLTYVFDLRARGQ